MPPLTTLFPYTTLFRSLEFAYALGAALQEPPEPGRLAAEAQAAVNQRIAELRAQRAAQGDASTTTRRLLQALEIERPAPAPERSEEHTSELQSLRHLVCHRSRHSFPTRRSSDLSSSPTRWARRCRSRPSRGGWPPRRRRR